MTVVELLSRLRDLRITITADGDRLRVNAARGTLTPELRDALTSHKGRLLELLRTKVADNGEAPITRVPRDQANPLSFAQERLWFLDQLTPGDTAYSIPYFLRLEGPLDVDALHRTLQEIVVRHEALRTAFPAVHGEPRQVILDDFELPLPIERLDGTREEREATAHRLATEEILRPFDLARGPLVRARLLHVDDQDHVLLLALHHAAIDIWSIGLLRNELSTLYEAFRAHRPSPLEPLPVQYVDFTAWQRRHLDDAVIAGHLAWWEARLAGAETLALPTDHPRPAVQSFAGGRHRSTVPGPVHDGLRRLAREEKASVFMVTLAAFQLLLHRYCGQDDIVIGTPVVNRDREEIKSLIGFFSNTLVMRGNFGGNRTFRSLLRETRETALGAYAHQALPFETLVNKLQPVRDLSRNPIFQVFFAQINTEPIASDASRGTGGMRLADLTVTSFAHGKTTTHFDLELDVGESATGLVTSYVYSRDLFDAATIERMDRHYQNLLAAIVAAPDQPAGTLPIMDDAERDDLIVGRNRTETPVDELTVPEFVHRAAATRPDATAVVFEQTSLTYAQLETQADRLARHLRGLGVGRGDRVGLCVDRSPDMLVGLLGVQMTGAAYVPLDPALPDERLRFMLDDARVAAIVTTDTVRERLDSIAQHDAPIASLDALPESDADTDHDALPRARPDDVAYVIYTSGSTGRPKGVEVLHRGVVNFLQSMRRAPGFAADDTLLAVTTLSFDIAVLELLLPLVTGGTVVIAPADSVADGAAVGRLLDAHDVTVMQATPATWQLLVQSGWRGRPGLKMLCGGEALLRPLADDLLARGGELWNMYGPTETTIWSATTRIHADDTSISIGRPIDNTQLYVLDAGGGLVPDGAIGELCIAGDGVARGYLDRPDLTADRFVVDPFRGDAGARMYKTGDLVRYDAAGRLQFLGRVDHQVKLRGFRIELGEVESALVAHDAVEQAVVLLHDEGTEHARLVAYVVGGADATPAALREHLADGLPDYMIPAAFAMIDAMPLSPAGKIDRRRLAEVEVATAPEAAFVAPRDPVEIAVAEEMATLLRRPAIGAHDDFFQLGGHSLLATRLVSRIREAFRVEFPLSTVFADATVAGIAARIEATRRSDDDVTVLPPIEPVPRGERPPLSFAQQRLWFLDQLGASSAYNVGFSLRHEGRLDLDRLRDAFAAVAARHETLRTSFPTNGAYAYQHIADAVETPIAVVDVAHLTPEAGVAEAQRAAGAEFQRPFDLATGPLLRATIVRMRDDDALVIVVHHIVCDGWSLQLLRREIITHYDALVRGIAPDVPTLPVQYPDFAAWQNTWLDEAALRPQMDYWRTQLAGELPVLELPTDRPRPPVQTFNGGSRGIAVTPALYDAIRGFTRDRGVTTAMVMLAAFKVLLSRYTGQQDLVVGSPIAGRTRTEIEDIIGFFVNSLVMRTDLSGDPSFDAVVDRVQRVALEAYDHQDLPFEQLVDELDPERDLGHNPLFQVVFAMQNAVDSAAGAQGGFTGMSTDATVTRTDIELHLFEGPAAMRGMLVYNTDLFDGATIERMIEHYLRLLQAAIDDPTTPIATLPMMSEAERKDVLVTWNDTDVPFAADRCIHTLIEDRADETPDAVALVFGGEELTYAALDARANRIAHVLRGMDVGRDVMVGLCVDRGLDMIAGLLGILKAGGAYVPIDAAYPRDRIAFMLEDSQAPVLVTQAALLETLPATDARVLCLDRDAARIDAAPDTRPEPVTTADDLAYVIYTSGSTGQPKAALLPHRGLCKVSEAQRRAFDVTPDDRVLQFSSLSFDACTFDVVMALPKGATLVLGTREALQPGPELAAFMRQHAVTVITVPPTALGAVPETDLPALRVITVAGEACPPELVARWAPGRRFFNLYGPTEATIWTTMAELTAGSRVHIGRPIDNTRVRVLDRHGQLVPAGVPGELHIGGVGLARGYHRRPELTAERFVDDPYASGARLYRTGDLVRWRDDGTLEFLGRVDHQVKLRGFRIELGEIEAVLAQHPAVREAVAVVRDDDRDRRLVAYVVDDVHWTPDDADDGREDLVGHWRSLYEETYGETPRAAPDPTFNIAGWDSSFDGEPIPAAEMREWVERTVERIRDQHPGRVLELGCGSGLLLYRIAPHCDRYVGTDFSHAAVDAIGRHIGANGAFGNVALRQGAADEIVATTDERFDTIVLNSVVQYFPDGDYLARVLTGAAGLLAPGGRIFVGDVRSLPLLRAFHTAVQLHAAPDDLDLRRLRQRIDHHLNQDQELVVDPTFFDVMQERIPGITTVEIRPKRGAYDNELSRYRYDVVLHAGGDPPPAPHGAVLDWARGGFTIAALHDRLRDESPETIVLTGVPNARTRRDVVAVERTRDAGLPDVAALRLATDERVAASPGVDPEALHTLAHDLGYAISFDLAAGRSDGSLDVVLHRTIAGPMPAVAPPTRRSTDLSALTNDPLRGRRLRHLVPALREHARDRLPEYMVPAAFVLLDSLPVTPNGKIDRRALPAPETLRSDLASAYAEPGTPVESALANAWAQVLGLEQVGIHDNFFELGGDSIQSVQVVAVAREAGVRITARDLFQHQTVAALAAVATPIEGAAVSEDELVVGDVPLGPIQRWFVEQNLAAPDHFNQSVLLEARDPVDPEALREVLDALIRHHDALRLRLVRSGDGWRQHAVESDDVALEVVDLAPVSARERAAFIERTSGEIQTQLDLARGPVIRVALFRADDEPRDRLLLAIHHIAVDGVSWRVLLEDLERGLDQRRAGNPVTLPPRTTSIRTWVERLGDHAGSPELAAAARHWIDQPWDAIAPLPCDTAAPPEADTVGAAAHVVVTLSAAQTSELLRDVPAAYGTRINDVLLTALARAMTRWTGREAVLVDLEGHGRAAQFDDLDLSRTVGWFTAIHPLLLRVPGVGDDAWDPGAALKVVKEKLRAIPGDGVPFGIARYLARDQSMTDRLRAIPPAPIAFNYLGQLDATWGRDAAFARSPISAGPSRAAGNRREHRLEVNGAITDGALRTMWTYSPAHHDHATIAAVADDYTAALAAIIAHCAAPDAGGLTPSDFSELDVGHDELEDILAETEQGEA